MKKSIALILVILQVLCVLVACDSGKKPADTSDPTVTTAPGEQGGEDTVDTSKLSEAERRALVDDELPDDQNFGDRDFIIVTLDAQKAYYLAEEQTGDSMNDAIYDRNTTVETDYGVKIRTLTYADRHSCRAAIQQAMTSGDTEMFDLVSYHVSDNGATAVAGLYQNWHEIPYVNFEKPWWGDSNTEDLTVNGKAYLALGDMSITSVDSSYCLLLNKKLASDANLGDLYQVVRDGKWTIEKIAEICEQVYQDTNANGIKDLEDVFGMTSTTGNAVVAYQWAFDNPIIKKDESGVPQFVINIEKYADIVTEIVELYNTGIGVFSNAVGSQDYYTLFNNGQALLVCANLANMPLTADVIEFDMGVLPYPKWDEDQKEYLTMVGGHADAMGVSIIENEEETAIIGLITEAMCAESYKQIYPVYYDKMLKNRYADMPDDAEMIDIVVDGRVFDIGFIYDNWKGAGFWMQTLVQTNNTNFASYYASNWGAVENYYKQVLALFED